MRKKYESEVYVAMRDGGLTNRRIGDLLDVDESSVRRGLAAVNYEERTPTVRTVLAQLAEVLERDRHRI